jgi:hypothetical protein
MGRSLGALLGLLLLALGGTAEARHGAPPRSASAEVAPRSELPERVLPAIDVEARLAEDASRPGPGPQRFAVPHDEKVTPATHGTWEGLADGGRLWRYRVFAPGAASLNFGFTRYRLPPGATLHIVGEDEDGYEGPYTHADNKDHGQLWTPIVPGGRAVVELYVPADPAFAPELVLSRIGVGYRGGPSGSED